MSVISVSYWENLIGSSLSHFLSWSQNISCVRIMTVWRISQFFQNWSNISVSWIIFVDLIAAPKVCLLTTYLFVYCMAFTVRDLLKCNQMMGMVVAVVKDLELFTVSYCRYKYHEKRQPVHLVNIMER